MVVPIRATGDAACEAFASVHAGPGSPVSAKTMVSFMLSQRARRHPTAGCALATLAAVALIAAGSAGEADAEAAAESPPATRGSTASAGHGPLSPAPRRGTSARLTVFDDHVLEIWRDRQTGELALHQEPEGPPGSTLREVVRVRGQTIVTTEEDELGIARFTTRARLSRALSEIETVRVGLRRIEAALARGQAAPEPAWLRQSRVDQRQARELARTADFGHDAGALARAAGRPVAWLGSSAAALPLHAAQLVTVEHPGVPRDVPFAVVAYARPSYPLFTLAFVPPGGGGPPAVRVYSVPIRSRAGREILRGLRPSPRFGGKPVRVGSFGVDVRLGPLVVQIDAGRLPLDRLPALVARLRLRSP